MRWEEIPNHCLRADPSTPLQAGLRLWSFTLGGTGGELVCWSHTQYYHQLCSGLGAAITSGSHGSEFTLKLRVGVGRVYFCQRCGPKRLLGESSMKSVLLIPLKTSIFVYISISIIFITVMYDYNL